MAVASDFKARPPDRAECQYKSSVIILILCNNTKQTQY